MTYQTRWRALIGLDAEGLQLPTDWLHRTPFSSYQVPGLVLALAETLDLA